MWKRLLAPIAVVAAIGVTLAYTYMTGVDARERTDTSQATTEQRIAVLEARLMPANVERDAAIRQMLEDIASIRAQLDDMEAGLMYQHSAMGEIVWAIDLRFRALEED